MVLITLFLVLALLFLLKIVNLKKIEGKNFQFSDCFSTLTEFKALKYYANYTSQEQKSIKINNIVNAGLIIILITILCYILIVLV